MTVAHHVVFRVLCCCSAVCAALSRGCALQLVKVSLDSPHPERALKCPQCRARIVETVTNTAEGDEQV